jgi:molybdopterin-guanine dinucleotide biosynthesis protein A
VLACDLPFVTEDLIRKILSHTEAQTLAIGYHSAFDGRAEPLCALWNPTSLEALETAFRGGLRCARKAMESLNPLLFDLPIPSALDNINNPNEKHEALQQLNNPRQNSFLNPESNPPR